MEGGSPLEEAEWIVIYSSEGEGEKPYNNNREEVSHHVEKEVSKFIRGHMRL